MPWAHRERDRVLVRAEVAGVEVARYLDGRGTIATSSPRPVLHPVRTLAGVGPDRAPSGRPRLAPRHRRGHPRRERHELLGRWTYVHGEGYVLLDNHGEIVGSAPDQQGDGFTQRLDWVGHDGSIVLHEERSVRWAALDERA